MSSSIAELQAFIDAQSAVAVALDECLNVLASNAAARSAWSGFSSDDNLARSVFLDPALDEMLEARSEPAEQIVELLREHSSEHGDRWAGYVLVGQLMAHSADFARMWANPIPLVREGTIRSQGHDGTWETFDYAVTRWPDDPSVRVMTWVRRP